MDLLAKSNSLYGQFPNKFWPPLWSYRHPGIKKIVASDENGTPLSVEIDNFDDIRKEAILHVKIPYISATVDTNFYISWEDATKDDCPVVGHTGSVAARHAWDDDFAFVAHMATVAPHNNPAMLQINSIIENTLALESNNLDEANLEYSASHGRHIGFDNEWMNFEPEDWMQPPGDLCVEAYVYCDNENDYGGILSKDEAADERQWALTFNNSSNARLTITSHYVGASSLTNGIWYYLAGIFSAGNWAEVRVDKVQDHYNETVVSSVGEATTPLSIGNFLYL